MITFVVNVASHAGPEDARRQAIAKARSAGIDPIRVSTPERIGRVEDPSDDAFMADAYRVEVYG